MTDVISCLLWLTLNVYHEARSEPLEGQMAVAHVTLNRSEERLLPVREVVTQPAQFSWYGKKPILPDDTDSFLICLTNTILAANSEDLTAGATYYHHVSVQPYWAEGMELTGRFGTHFFYKED